MLIFFFGIPHQKKERCKYESGKKGREFFDNLNKNIYHVVWYIHSLPEEDRKVSKGTIKSKNCLHLYQQANGVLLTRRIQIIFLNYITRFHSDICVFNCLMMMYQLNNYATFLWLLYYFVISGLWNGGMI